MDPTEPRFQPESLANITAEQSIATLNSEHPVDSLGFHAEDLRQIKESQGLEGVQWIRLLNNSDFKSGPAEAWLGKQVIEPAIKAGKWIPFTEPDNIDRAYATGYLERMIAADGSYQAVPTKKLAEFVKSRLSGN